MGIKISGEPFAVPTLELTCDGDHGLFPAVARFHHGDGFIGEHRLAMAAGWLERQGSQGRLWLCPECSRKATTP